MFIMQEVVDLGEMFTPAQAGRELGVGRTRLLQLAVLHQLPVVWTPLGRLFPVAAVRELAAKRSAGESSQSSV
jgi:hypothetical protein